MVRISLALIILSILHSSAFGMDIGSKVATFTLPNTRGELVKLSDYEDKRKIIYFWSIAMPICQQEMIELDDFYQRFKDSIIVIAIAEEEDEKDKEKVRKFVKERDIDFPVLFDEGRVSELYHTDWIVPYLYLVEEDGLISYERRGVPYPIEDDLEKIIPKGGVNISSEPPEAEVYINGVYRGRTPILITGLIVGDYQVRLSREGYVDWSQEARISNGKIDRLNIRLERAKASLEIISTPLQAEIYIDREYYSLSPALIGELSPGTYLIEIVKLGYDEWRGNVELSPGETKGLEVTLNIPTSSFRIVSFPPSSSVYLNDEYKGETPLYIERIPVGIYQLRVSKPGYEEFTDIIGINAGNENSRRVYLHKAAYSKLVITSDPEGAEVYLDGEFKGRTPLIELQLMPRGYEIKVVKEGYISWYESIELFPGRSRKLEIKLDRDQRFITPVDSCEQAKDYYEKGKAYLDENKLEEAIEAYGEALEIAPNCVETYRGLGTAYERQGKLDESAFWYEKAIEIASLDLDLYYELGRIYIAQDRIEEAIELYNRALSIDPEDPQIKGALDEIYQVK